VLTEAIALVDQDISLFEGTIRNVTMWDETIAERVIVEAARDACIHDEINTRPGGYEYRFRRAVVISAEGSGSGSRSLAPWFRIRNFWCSMRARARSIRRQKKRSSTTCTGAGVRV
jgi:hypothetical protein